MRDAKKDSLSLNLQSKSESRGGKSTEKIMIIDDEESANGNAGTVNIGKLMQTIKKKKEDLAKWDSWVKRHYKGLQDKQHGYRGAAERRRYERQMAHELRTAEEEYCINIMENAMMSPK